MSIFTSDVVATQARIELVDEYMSEHVFGERGFVCAAAGACRRSVMVDRAGRARTDRNFAEGQLSHIGHHYDVCVDGQPMRVLVIAMETGREDVGVSLEARRLQLAQSAALSFASRNPHMRGTTTALRLAFGREPGTDRDSELLRVGNDGSPVHLFDCYAMANIRLCSATVAGTSSSKGTAVMSGNCLRHLAATIAVLEPTLVIIQGIPVARDIEPLVSKRRNLTNELADVTLAGVPDVVLACFTHPSAKSVDQHWGRLTSADYLWSTVVPTMRLARSQLELT